MELFLLLVPAVFLPVGLSLAGLWWLFQQTADAQAAKKGEPR